MTETLNLSPMPPNPRERRRFKLGPARIGFLLVLEAAGLVLLAHTADPDLPVVSAREARALAPTDYPTKDQAACSSTSLNEILAHPDIIPTHYHPLLGQQAPDFELVDHEGNVRSLMQLLDGRPAVLIFYHGYHCVACVRQLFDFNRDLPLFHEVGAQVVAISADPPELTRQRFQQHGTFGFPVLSDPEHKVGQTYGVFTPAQTGNTTDILRHGTFVIDAKGTVQWVNVGDAPFRRNPALLQQLRGALP